MGLRNYFVEYFSSYHYIDTSFENDYSNTDWTQRYKPDAGRCFSYRVPEHLHDLKVTTIRAYLVEPVDFFLHHPGQFLTWNIFHVTSRLGEQTYLDIGHEVNLKNKINNCSLFR